MSNTRQRNPGSLDIKDAQVIFKAAWEELEEEVGRTNLRFPKELILLGGAPGAGKGTQTEFLMNARGLTCRPIVVSELLVTPEAEAIKAQGGMVGDKQVVGILLRKLLDEEYRDGVVLDGFPRTQVQVECLKLLVNRINQLHDEFENTPLATSFRRPIVHALVLFISERTSIDRQLKRGREVRAHNREAKETGLHETFDERVTDLSEEAARRRYRVFKEQTWNALTSLKEIYHYHYINAEGTIDEVEANILDELQYQSSLELEPRTYDRLRALPLAEDIIRHARQELVRRLDSYELEHTDLFAGTVDLINHKFLPIITRHALSGRSVVNTEDPIFDDPLALSMLIDIFSERGFNATVDKHNQKIPERVDLETGEIHGRARSVYRIHILFKGSELRRR